MANKGKDKDTISCSDGEAEIISLLNKLYERAGWILFWVIIILFAVGGSNY